MNNLTKCLFRVDANGRVGLGHIVRCTALMDILRNDFRIVLFFQSMPRGILDDLDQMGVATHAINSEDDFHATVADDCLVVLDGYTFGPEYQRRIKTLGAKLICIDDLCIGDFFADLIINHAPGVTPGDYRAQPYTKFALGSGYVLLRKPFLESAKNSSSAQRTGQRNLFVCFGGADPRNLTYNVTSIAKRFDFFERILVVTGEAFVYSDTITDLAVLDQRIEHYSCIDAQGMARLLSESLVAVVPASGVMLEALACKSIVVTGMYADNQSILLDRYTKSGVAISTGHFEDNSLVMALEKAIASHIAYEPPFDGYSLDRVRDLVLDL